MPEERNMNETEVNQMIDEGVVDSGSKDLALVCLGAVGVGIAAWEGLKWAGRKIKKHLPTFGKKDEQKEETKAEGSEPEE